MNLDNYFTETKGYGVLATADSAGEVNAAVYARPHFFDENTVAFIMRERIPHPREPADQSSCHVFVH